MKDVLPVHGFVLAGGKSSRMGQDKALLEFCGRPMVEIAVEKLREFCAEVWIAGNREDLERVCAGGDGERGLRWGRRRGLRRGWGRRGRSGRCLCRWMCRWFRGSCCGGGRRMTLSMSGIGVSHLYCESGSQPAFCMLRQECAGRLSGALDEGERRLEGTAGPGG